jgi:hypothetical protein
VKDQDALDSCFSALKSSSGDNIVETCNKAFDVESLPKCTNNQECKDENSVCSAMDTSVSDGDEYYGLCLPTAFQMDVFQKAHFQNCNFNTTGQNGDIETRSIVYIPYKAPYFFDNYLLYCSYTDCQPSTLSQWVLKMNAKYGKWVFSLPTGWQSINMCRNMCLNWPTSYGSDDSVGFTLWSQDTDSNQSNEQDLDMCHPVMLNDEPVFGDDPVSSTTTTSTTNDDVTTTSTTSTTDDDVTTTSTTSTTDDDVTTTSTTSTTTSTLTSQ